MLLPFFVLAGLFLLLASQVLQLLLPGVLISRWDESLFGTGGFGHPRLG